MLSPAGFRGLVTRVPAAALLLGVLAAAPAAVLAQSGRADLARARVHYNQRQFDEAIATATLARTMPDTADVAGIVLARAHLERYRERADPADLSAAREVLNSIRAGGLEPRDQVETLLAVGESLFLEDDFGAAAAIFESALDRAAALDQELAEALVEWWGSAVERQAGGLSREARIAVCRRLADRMRTELARTPSSAGATYWLVVALRGAGEVDGAWDAAVAAWARARLIGQRAPSLRADLDRLVLQGIIPDRVRQLAQDQRPGTESQFRAEWELVKERWK
jgi:tetratricopeptide (TPR) repeat protein